MNRVNIFLILLILGVACSTEQKTGQKEIKTTVFDRENNLPIENAQVTLVSIVEARDINTDIKYTDSVGLCSYSLIVNPLAQYQVGTKKEGFFSYLGDDSADTIRSYTILNEKTKDDLVLYLTSDSLHQKNYWAKRIIRFDPDTLIYLLKTNNYPGSVGLPLLSREDIPVLLTIGNDTTIITHFPTNPVSS
ncbi:MAG: hypothetical protein HQ542_12185, partial [Bacteroidia bacterium]|nr:hypothetical protein [Bacteroidia bacterium]